jgi:ABC-2 type transport system ATP-binding protein
LIELQDVTKAYRNGITAVNGVSLTLDSGVVGLLGPNGAGKSTLMQLMATVTRPTAGRVVFDGVDLADDPDHLRRRLGYLPQDFGVYDNLTAREFLTYFAALKGVTSRARVGEMLERVNLHSVADRAASTFSHGMRQRLGIAQALIGDPIVLIVDEPTAGLDPEERARFRGLLSEIGLARLVVLSTHIVSDVESIATRIAVMRDGRLLQCATPEVLIRQAAGTVWSAVLSSDQFAAAHATLTVSSAVRRGDGVHARIIQGESPGFDAVPAEPTLEDAFLGAMAQAL